MSFNPEFLRITNKKNFISFIYSIDNCVMQEVAKVKYLGVVIDQRLTLNDHIKYKAMVRPIMEYSSTVWDPHTSVNINRLQVVQRSAVRICYKDFSRYSSVSTMLVNLKCRRTRAKLKMLYKIMNHSIAIPDDCLTPVLPSLRSGYFNQYQSGQLQILLSPSTIKLWNRLPCNITVSNTRTEFCNKLDNYNYYTCAL